MSQPLSFPLDYTHATVSTDQRTVESCYLCSPLFFFRFSSFIPPANPIVPPTRKRNFHQIEPLITLPESISRIPPSKDRLLQKIQEVLMEYTVPFSITRIETIKSQETLRPHIQVKEATQGGYFIKSMSLFLCLTNDDFFRTDIEGEAQEEELNFPLLPYFLPEKDLAGHSKFDFLFRYAVINSTLSYCDASIRNTILQDYEFEMGKKFLRRYLAELEEIESVYTKMPPLASPQENLLLKKPASPFSVCLTEEEMAQLQKLACKKNDSLSLQAIIVLESLKEKKTSKSLQAYLKKEESLQKYPALQAQEALLTLSHIRKTLFQFSLLQMNLFKKSSQLPPFYPSSLQEKKIQRIAHILHHPHQSNACIIWEMLRSQKQRKEGEDSLEKNLLEKLKRKTYLPKQELPSEGRINFILKLFKTLNMDLFNCSEATRYSGNKL